MKTIKLTKIIKELTGEDAVDIFGGDAENIVKELNEGSSGSSTKNDKSFKKKSKH